MSRVPLALLLPVLSVLAFGSVHAQDPIVVDPAHYRLEFENDRVRVFRIRYGPGESSVMHLHKPYVGVSITDGSARFELADGRVQESRWKAGGASWSNGERHRPQNTGAAPFELIAVELKDPPQTSAAGEADLRAASEALVRAEAAKDVDASLQFWADDAIVQPVNAPLLSGKAAVRRFYEDAFRTLPILDFVGTTSRIEVARSGELGWEHGVNRFTLQGPNGPVVDVGKYLAVWRRENGAWKVAALSFSSDAAPAVASAPASVVVPASTAAPGGQAQSPLLPAYTADQRWDRAALHTTLFALLMLREGMEAGKTAEEVGRGMAAIAGPSWSVERPFDMARGIHRNWLLWPTGEVQVHEAADGSVDLRMSRPYRASLGDAGTRWGTSLGDLEAMFRAFYESIAEQKGLEYRQAENGDWITAQIRRR